MSNTYSNIFFHVVFGVKYRLGLIHPSWRTDLYKYINAVIESHGHKTMAIGGVSDHIHILYRANPSQSPSELVKIIKSESSKMINATRRTMGRFAWQKGFGIFSYSAEHVPTVMAYIANQETHHRKQSFADELRAILTRRSVTFDDRYLPQSPQ